MKIRELTVSGAYEIEPTVHADSRGAFLEWYRPDILKETVGHSIEVRQANTSVSSRGVLRGIHFTDIPPGQAKYVTVMSGAIIDFVVDIRVGSPTFGAWDSVVLDSESRKALYIREGLGHAFLSLRDNSIVSYLVSDIFRSEEDRGLNPLDPRIGLSLPLPVDEVLLSPKDASAPTLAEAQAKGLLPTMEALHGLYGQSTSAKSAGHNS